MTRNEMMAVLVGIQNEIENRDILTITAWMSDEELIDHIIHYQNLIS